MNVFPSSLYNCSAENEKLVLWVRQDLSEADYLSVIEWIKTRPQNLHELMTRFPLGCVVKANRKLQVPAPGVYGLLQSYIEPTREEPFGLVRIANSYEGAGMSAQCDPDWLEIVDCRPGFFPDDIRRILKGVRK